MVPRPPLDESARLLRMGDASGARDQLLAALREGSIQGRHLTAAGRSLRRMLRAAPSGAKPWQVLVLGQCTTTWLADALLAVSWREGTAVTVEDGPYDAVLQHLLEPGLSGVPDLLVLLPWHDRLLRADARDPAERIADEVGYWQQVWAAARQLGITRIVQIGYDWTEVGAAGYHLGGQNGGDQALIESVNAGLRANLPEGAYFLALDVVSGVTGRRHFYDARQWFWTRQPFSADGVVRLAEHVHAGLRAITSGPRKLLVLDLDDTLWGGVVGEAGPLGVALGDTPEGAAFRAFQAYLQGLAKRGILLAVCSKNELEDALAPFRVNPDMLLREADFASFIANWDPKAENLRRIAAELKLSLDACVFFDDNPAEREQVRQALPMVAVVDVPSDPAGYIAALQEGLWFEVSHITEDDRRRVERYTVDRSLREAQQEAVSLEVFLDSLSMQAVVRELEESDIQRVEQLLSKTNQFNLTTRRHTAAEVRALLARPGAIGLGLRLKDRFVDHGLVALVIAVPGDVVPEPALHIDSFLMSCRVIGRTVEYHLLRALAERAHAQGWRRVSGEFIPTAKNQLAARFYSDAGLIEVPDGAGSRLYAADLPFEPAQRCHILPVD